MEKIKMFADVVSQMVKLYEQKNSDYGDSFGEAFKELGIVSAVTRMNDKMNRLKSLTVPGKEQCVADEKIEDTLIDLANYAVMTIIELRSKEIASEKSTQKETINYNDYLERAMQIEPHKLSISEILMLGEDETEILRNFLDIDCKHICYPHSEKLTKLMLFMELNDIPEEIGIYLLQEMVKERNLLAEKMIESLFQQ